MTSADRQPAIADAADILGRVRAQVRFDSATPRSGTAVRVYTGRDSICRGFGDGSTLRTADLLASLGDPEIAAGLEVLHGHLESDFAIAISRFGEIPPTPRTPRAIVGRAVLRAIRALLWWYTRSLQIFGDSAAEQFRHEADLLALMARRQAEYRAELAALREEVRRLETRSGGPETR